MLFWHHRKVRLTAPAAADREPHPEAALLTKASFLKRMREQFPTLEKVAVPSLGGVAFRIVMAMKQHFAGEARGNHPRKAA